MTRLFQKLLLTAIVALVVCAGVGTVAHAWAEEHRSQSATDGLGVAHHADDSIVTVRSRLPLPTGAALTSAWLGVALTSAEVRTAPANAPRRRAPLYALLRAFRL